MDEALTVGDAMPRRLGIAVAENDAENYSYCYAASLPAFLRVVAITRPGVVAHANLQSLAYRMMACVAA